MVGAGRERSIGVSIRLPFETAANFVIAGDPKHVSMKYFFTRKLMLVKESSGVRVPARRVRHARRDVRAADADPDRQGRPGADRVPRHARRRVLGGGRRVRRDPPRRRVGSSSPPDRSLYCITDSTDEVAVREIERFYANYHCVRYIGDELVIRMHHGPTDAQLADAQRALRQPRRRRRRSGGSTPLRHRAPPERPRRPRPHRVRVRPPRLLVLRGLIDAVNASRRLSRRLRSSDVVDAELRRTATAFSTARRALVELDDRRSGRSRLTVGGRAAAGGRRRSRRAPRRSLAAGRPAPSRSSTHGERLGEQIDRMADLDPASAQRRLQVHAAPRVGTDDDRRAGAARRPRRSARDLAFADRRPRARAAAPSRRRRRRSTAPSSSSSTTSATRPTTVAPAGAPSGRGAGGTDPARSPACRARAQRRQHVEPRCDPLVDVEHAGRERAARRRCRAGGRSP